MKCQACGYEEQTDRAEKFRMIFGQFRTKDTSQWIDYRVNLYACPKCNTVILDDQDNWERI